MKHSYILKDENGWAVGFFGEMKIYGKRKREPPIRHFSHLADAEAFAQSIQQQHDKTVLHTPVRLVRRCNWIVGD